MVGLRENSNGVTNGSSSVEVGADEISKWSATLPIAKVTRWGGMISTPDEFFQEMIRKALLELDCPSSIIDKLMENCHERNWPSGLNTLATRQSSRDQYEKYVCKRLACMQAVVILFCDNPHMPEDMILKPGIVMAFAYGVE